MTWLVQFRDWRDGSLVKEEKETREEALTRGQELMDATGLTFTQVGKTLGWDAIGLVHYKEKSGTGLLAKLYIKEL